MATELDTISILVKIWPVLVSFAGIIAALAAAQAVAIYRIEQNAAENKSLKTSLFRQDGTLIYVPVSDFKELEERMKDMESLCEQIQSVEKDMKKVETQQTINMEKNLTIKDHESICERVNLKIKEMLHNEFKVFKQELFSELRPAK